MLYTRIVEHKNFEIQGDKRFKLVIMKKTALNVGLKTIFCPVNNENNQSFFTHILNLEKNKEEYSIC